MSKHIPTGPKCPRGCGCYLKAVLVGGKTPGDVLAWVCNHPQSACIGPYASDRIAPPANPTPVAA